MNQKLKFWIDDSNAVGFGLLEKCSPTENGRCRLSIGSVSFDLGYTTEEEITGLFGHIQFFFPDAKSCSAFLSVHWEKSLPVDWWYPYGGVDVFMKGKSSSIYRPSEGITETTLSDITNACKLCNANNNCFVQFCYRAYY